MLQGDSVRPDVEEWEQVPVEQWRKPCRGRTGSKKCQIIPEIDDADECNEAKEETFVANAAAKP